LALLWQHQRHLDPHVAWDRNVLPAFDAYAYVAMAERPTVFTVAPWGYRLLTPALVAALPFRHIERRFQAVTEGALLLAATGLFFFLRRLGYTDLPACVGALAFTLSGPVGEAVRYRYLAEPVTVLLEIVLLGAVVAGAGTPVFALVLLLGTWSKEFFLLLSPVVLLGRAHQVGWRRGFLDMLVAAAPALAASILLRALWTPHVASPYAALGVVETLGLAVDRLRTSWPLWLGAVPLHGLTPLALLGAFRASGRRWAPPGLYVAAVALLPPFLNPVAFFPADIPRLLIYALPALIPLALAALQGIWAAPAPTAVAPASPRKAAAAWAAVALAALAPVLLLDRYRRLDLGGPRDGPYVLALCRESWRAARRLERGEAVVLDPAGFTWEAASREELGRMRWFLREGWGAHAHYGTGDVVMEEPRASLVLPILTPRDVGVSLELEAPRPAALAVEVNGQLAGHWHGAGGVRVPARLLVRGDNVVTLVSLDGTRGARLRGLAYEP
jgi:hypothetical protein